LCRDPEHDSAGSLWAKVNVKKADRRFPIGIIGAKEDTDFASDRVQSSAIVSYLKYDWISWVPKRAQLAARKQSASEYQKERLT